MELIIYYYIDPSLSIVNDQYLKYDKVEWLYYTFDLK